MESLARGTPHCFLEGILEIEAMLDEFGTLGAHGRVLLGAITVRHVNDWRRRGDAGDSGLVALQLVHVDKSAADLKGTDERMVFRASPRPRRPRAARAAARGSG